MRVQTPDIVRSVARTLEHEVLPEVPGGWPASYLRSAVMLLTYLEDLVVLGPPLQEEDDRELCQLLVVAADELDAAGGAPDLARRIREGVDGAPGPDATGEAAHEARRGLLCELVVVVYRGPQSMPATREGVARYRERSLAREDAVWQRAESLSVM